MYKYTRPQYYQDLEEEKEGTVSKRYTWTSKKIPIIPPPRTLYVNDSLAKLHVCTHYAFFALTSGKARMSDSLQTNKK